MNSKVIKKAIIKLHYKCNQKCLFCRVDEYRKEGFELSTQEVIEKIKKSRNLGIDMILLSGGEPTIRKDIFEITNFLKNRGFPFGLITNGRMLSYKKFFNKLLHSGLKYIHTSLHGSNARIHNAITQSDSFDDVIKSLNNIHKSGVEIYINSVINRKNLDDLENIIDLVSSYTPVNHKFSLMEPKGLAKKNAGRLYARPDIAGKRAISAINYGIKKYKNIRFALEGFPHCQIDGYEDFIENLFTLNVILMSEVFEKDFFPVDYGKRRYGKKCYLCSELRKCPGVYKEYLKKYKEKDIIPLVKKISNSYNFYFYKKIKEFPRTGCKIFKRQKNNKEVLLLQNNGVEIYKTDTNDFSDAELLLFGWNLKQFYIDLAGKVENINFREMLKGVKLHSYCPKCPELKNCTGVFVPQNKEIFEIADKKVEDFILSLNGRVLDIGCGEIFYKDILWRKIENGDISYIGIDPFIEPSHILLEKAKFIKTSIEDFHHWGKKFDWILMLRSYSHFEEIDKVIKKCIFLLKDGGKILIVDNIPYGIIRIDKNFKPLECHSFFHYRRHTSYDVIKVLKNYPLSLKKHIPVKPFSANQWLLIFEKNLNLIVYPFMSYLL